MGEFSFAQSQQERVAALQDIHRRQFAFLKRKRDVAGSAGWKPRKRHRKVALSFLVGLDNQAKTQDMYINLGLGLGRAGQFTLALDMLLVASCPLYVPDRFGIASWPASIQCKTIRACFLLFFSQGVVWPTSLVQCWFEYARLPQPLWT